MDADLLLELSGETWMAATYLDELMADLPATDSDLDLIVASRRNETLTTVRQWVQTGAAPAWSECLGLSPELRCWRLMQELCLLCGAHKTQTTPYHPASDAWWNGLTGLCL